MQRHFFAVQSIGQLNQDAGAVAHQLIGTDGTAMVEVFKNLERILDDGMAFFTPDMRNKPHAAGIMFLLAGIKALCFQMLDFGPSRHAALLKKMGKGIENTASQQECQE
jgi:hypothetical protein